MATPQPAESPRSQPPATAPLQGRSTQQLLTQLLTPLHNCMPLLTRHAGKASNQPAWLLHSHTSEAGENEGASRGLRAGPIVCACVPVGSCAPGCIRILFFLWMCLAWGCLVPCRGASIWCHVSATSRKVSAVPLIIQKWFGGLWLHCWACRCMGSLVMMCCDTFRSFLPQVMQPGVVGSRQFCM